MLSERRKNEVDEVRVWGIQRLLEGVTLVLKEEHLIQKTMTITSKSESSVTSATTVTVASSITTASSSSSLEHFTSSSLECCDDEQDDEEEDVELGHCNDLTSQSSAKSDDDLNDDMPSSSSSCSSCENDDVEHDNGGISVVMQLYKKEDEDSASSSSSSVAMECAETEYTHVCIPCSDMVQCTDSTRTISLQETKNALPLPTVTTPRTREVPINCPICLSSYEPHQSICCSSNPQCPHVFHCECITHWFIEMGRRNNDIIIGHGTKLDEHSLLDYTLSCPCCRQPFLQEEDEQLPRKGGAEETEEKHKINEVRIKMTNKVTPLTEEDDEEQESPV